MPRGRYCAETRRACGEATKGGRRWWAAAIAHYVTVRWCARCMCARPPLLSPSHHGPAVVLPDAAIAARDTGDVHKETPASKPVRVTLLQSVQCTLSRLILAADSSRWADQCGRRIMLPMPCSPGSSSVRATQPPFSPASRFTASIMYYVLEPSTPLKEREDRSGR